MPTVPALKQWIKTHPWDSLCLVALSLLGLACGLWYRHILADDAMITFRVAENLAYGRGFVFNPGEVVQVTTTPLYALILAGGAWLAGSAPTAALWLNIGLAALIPPLAYDLGRRLSGWMTGLTGALLLMIMPLLVIAFSMESYLYVALVLASMDSYVARRYRLAGLLIGLTTMLRGDAVLLGAVLLTWDFLAQRRLRWRMIIPAIGIPAMWYLFATVYYGSPFPATLQAKTAQGQFNWLGRYFISGFYNFWKDWVKLYSPVFYLFPLLLLLGLIPVLRKERLWLILLLAELLYVLAFEGMRVTFAAWYYAPVTPGVALMIGRGVQLVVETVTRPIPAPPRRPETNRHRGSADRRGAGAAAGYGLPRHPRYCPQPPGLEGPGLPAYRPLDCPKYQSGRHPGHHRYWPSGLLVRATHHRYCGAGPAGCGRAHRHRRFWLRHPAISAGYRLAGRAMAD
jgi:hypothetical protein